MKYGIQENIARKLIFIDGITRCGKSLLTNIIPSLEKVEHIQFFTLLELVVPAVGFGTLDANYAKALLRLQLNELAYHVRLGRNVNFRSGDQSGVPNYKEPSVYHDRLQRKEGEEIVQELRTSDAFLPFQTHDLMVNLDALNRLDVDYRMIALFRHPVDNVYSWWTRGWGDRFGSDPRAFTLTLDHGGQLLPWYCDGIQDEWVKANPMERCILAALNLVEKSVRQYEKAPNKDAIHLMTFEDFTERTDEEMEKICKFLRINRTSRTAEFISAARCPRVTPVEERLRKISEFKAGTRAECFDRLMEFSKAYEASVYGLRQIPT
jgi:hypothetical protein